jgi:FKBP12-rapamycin complex-associated protein
VISIVEFNHELPVLISKQRPRKLELYGSDGKQYGFLLKGREDLRQDERVMQLFSMVNKLLLNDPETERKELRITKFSVVPLSVNTGLIGWVRNCDTLQNVIKEYRDMHGIK